MNEESIHLDVALLGTYPPRKCGIGTFTRDIFKSLKNENVDCKIVAIDNNSDLDYPREASFLIQQQKKEDYKKAAEYLNISSVDVINIQHEYGIYGGEQGEYLVEFLKELKKPSVITFHTILEQPNEKMKEVTQELINYADSVIVLANKAKEFLLKIYDIEENRIEVIPHGVPDVPFTDSSYYKGKFGFEGKTLLLTFGFLSPNKGLEVSINALKPVVEKHPEIIYCVQGVTHPELFKRFGDEYRNKLLDLVKELRLEENVVLLDDYLSNKELMELIGASDVYITPYLSKEQISSGTLAYALSAGKAIISTPYFCAEELLGEGRGLLFDFNDEKKLSEYLLDVLDDPTKFNPMRKKAYDFAREMIWRKVGRKYFELFRKVHDDFLLSGEDEFTNEIKEIPPPKFTHLERMTDDVGLVQHAKFAIPNRHEGYSTDDAGRAIPILLKQFNETGNRDLLSMATTNISFLYHAQKENGKFHNFFSYNRAFLDKADGEDTQGRVLWGLGYALYSESSKSITQLAHHMFGRAIENLELHYIQAKAYAMCGCYWYLKRFHGAINVERLMKKLADEIVEQYEKNKDENWNWFENEVTYGRSKICEVLLMAHEIFEEEKYKEIAIESLNFLTEIVFEEDMFAPIGSDGWYKKSGEKAKFIQQPIEGWYFMEAYQRAYEVTKEKIYLEKINVIFEWFMGHNVTGEALGNLKTGSCFDGIRIDGLNPNKGAESTLAFLYAVQVMNDVKKI